MIGPPDPVMQYLRGFLQWGKPLDAQALMFAAIATALVGAFIGMYFWDQAFDEEKPRKK